MPKETSLRFLLEEIDKSIEIIKIKAKSNKRKLKFFFFISLLFSTTTTLILAFDFVGYEKTQKNIALILALRLHWQVAGLQDLIIKNYGLDKKLHYYRCIN